VQIKRRTCPEEVPDGFFCVMGGCEGRLGRGRAAPIKYSVFPCAEHSDEPPKSRNRVRQWASRFPEFHLHCTKRNSSYLIGAALTLPPNNIFHTQFHNTEEVAFCCFSAVSVCFGRVGGHTTQTEESGDWGRRRYSCKWNCLSVASFPFAGMKIADRPNPGNSRSGVVVHPPFQI